MKIGNLGMTTSGCICALTSLPTPQEIFQEEGPVSQIGIWVIFPGILGYYLFQIGILGYSKPNLGYWDIALMSISGQPHHKPMGIHGGGPLKVPLGIQVSLRRFGILGFGPYKIGILGYGSPEIGIFGIPGPPLTGPYYY